MTALEVTVVDVTDHEAAVAEYIEPHPVYGGVADARVKGRGVPVWALISRYLLTLGPDAAEEVAQAYCVPLEAMQAAIDYYKLHKAEIDARLAGLAVP